MNRKTDRPDMTSAVDRGRKALIQEEHLSVNNERMVAKYW